jgi:predicted nucleic acid-binding protein
MPDLQHLPDGTRVFVDTNIFDLHFRFKSFSCTNFMSRIINGEVEAYVNTQVLTDLLHKLMLAEAYAKNIIAKRAASQLKSRLQSNRSIAAQLTDYQIQFENTLAFGLNILPINTKLLVETKAERLNYSLMTGDSLHLGSMNRCTRNRRKVPLRNIVTYDADFAHIQGLTVWKPIDVIP